MKLFTKQKWTHRQKTNLWLPHCKEWGDPLATWTERETVYVCVCVCVITQDELGKRNSFIYPWEGHHKTWWSLLASCCYPLSNQVNLYQGWDSRINATGQITCSDDKSLINNWFRVHVFFFFFNKILRHYQLSVHLVWPVATTPYPRSPPLG